MPTNAAEPTHAQPCRGVLCFGDSLTAGTTGSLFDQEHPYAPFLQQALDSDHNLTIAKVGHLGLPGWTAQRLLQEANHAQRGLRTLIQQWSDNNEAMPLSLVILMVGTNDLGLRPAEGASCIAQDIITLHQLCHQAGVPRTLAVAVPPSAYQTRSPPEAQLATDVNCILKEYCQETSRKEGGGFVSTFVEFPFGYNEQNKAYWSVDGLHFSKQGYQVLGESLCPHVQAVLKELDEEK